ncbi:MAG: tol-pal system protein YbgF [Methylophilaceae bacterium]|nr:tol-pal system protein YbgF [Methyloradius sp.]
MRQLILVLTSALAFLALTQTAHAGLFSDDEARKKIADLQQQVESQNQANQALSQRIATMEAVIKGQGLIDLLTQVDQLKQDLSNVKGQLEVTNHSLDMAQQRQKDLYVDVDGRLRKIETAAPATAVNTPAATDAPTAGAINPNSAVEAPTESKDFDAAQTLLKTGKYKEAFDAFGKFIQTYPGSTRLPEAQYSLGFSQFSLKNYKAAIATQQKLVKTYPDSSKAPDAMFNIANAQIQLADIDSAKKTLKELLSKYPSSEIAPNAKRRLSVLDSIKS